MQDKFIPMTPLRIGEQITAGILVYSDLNDFLLKKLYPEEQIFDIAFRELDQKLQEKYNSASSNFFCIQNPYEGQPVAALYEQDNKWYRAEIIKLDLTNNLANILFVDYGNKENIHLDNLRQLAPQFFKYEVQIFRCKLNAVSSLSGKNLIRATNFFYDSTDELCKSNTKTLKLVIKEKIGHERSSSIFSRLSDVIHLVEINYPLEDNLINENFDIIRLLYPGIRVQTYKHIFLVRHGHYYTDAAHNEKTLTPQGIEQANLTGKYLKQLGEKFKFVEFRSSPVIRAKQTTDQISKYLPNLSVKIDNLLSELAPLEISDENKQLNDVFYKYFRHGLIRFNNQSLILVCHANLIRALLCKVENRSVKFWKNFGLHHGSITHIAVSPNDELICKDYDNSDFIPNDLKSFI